jgi:hypothetical protein
MVFLRAGLDERFEAVLANIWLVTKTDNRRLFSIPRVAVIAAALRLETEVNTSLAELLGDDTL